MRDGRGVNRREKEREGEREGGGGGRVFLQKIPRNSVIGTNTTVALCMKPAADVRIYAQKTPSAFESQSYLP